MAGDLDVTERAVLQDPAGARGAPAATAESQDGERVIHRYGRLGIVAGEPQAARAPAVTDDAGLSDLERLGLRALIAGTLASFMTACVVGILM